MSRAPEQAILTRLAEAAEAVLIGLDEALELLGPVPRTIAEADALDKIQRTAVAAILKRVEQLQDIFARMFRTALLADGTDISAMTARDIANRAEKLGALADARAWSGLTRLRNRLAHEYPISATEGLERLIDAATTAPALHRIDADLRAFLVRQDLLPAKKGGAA